MFSWEKFSNYLGKHSAHAPKCSFALPLLRDGRVELLPSAVFYDSTKDIEVVSSKNIKSKPGQPIKPSTKIYTNDGKGVDLATFGEAEAEQFIKNLISRYPWFARSYQVKHAKEDARANPGQWQYYDGGNGYTFSYLGRVFEAYRQFETSAGAVDLLIKPAEQGKPSKRPAPSAPEQPAKRPAPSAAAAPSTAPVSPSLLPAPVSDLSTVCRDLGAEIERLPGVNNSALREATRRASEFIEKKASEGNFVAQAPVIFLGAIPELANWPSEMTTHQTSEYIKKKFKTMTKQEFERGWHGLEAYFQARPNGSGYVAKRAWMSIDHVLAQYFSAFHHPRFYAVMPPEVNSHLKNSPPIARMGFGIRRHELQLMHTWILYMGNLARKDKIQDMLLSSLVAALPVTALR